jgi:hypothetical protein
MSKHEKYGSAAYEKKEKHSYKKAKPSSKKVKSGSKKKPKK